MKITEAVKYVADKFVYKSDLPAFLWLWDYWFVMPEQKGKLTGDCEDFTLTCFWYYSDQNLWKFLWHLLITHKYRVFRAITINNEAHLLGSVDNLWFDNWTLAAVSNTEFFDRTQHKLQWQLLSPFMLLPLIIGYFVRSRT